MVDIVNICLRVDEFDEIMNYCNDILFCEDPGVHINVEVELAVDAESTDIAQVIPLVREEQLFNDVTCGSLIRRLGIAQLTVDIEHCLLLRVAGVFLQRIVYNGIVREAYIIAVKQD